MNSIPAKLLNGKIEYSPISFSRFAAANEGKMVDIVVRKSKRTDRQNRSLHLFLSQVAEALDKEGFTVQDVTAQIKKAEIHPTQEILKEIVWRPLQEIILGTKSTTELGKGDVDKVYEVFNKWLGENFHLHVPWPAYENEQEYIDVTTDLSTTRH